MSMRIHSGGAMKFCIGVFSSIAKMQKLNAKNSNDSEIFGASDYLPEVVFIHLFMEARGLSFQGNFIHQDN